MFDEQSKILDTEKNTENVSPEGMGTNTCPFCGAQVPKNYDVCPVCGTIISSKYREAKDEYNHVYAESEMKAQQAEKENEYSIASLCCGIASILFCMSPVMCLVFGIVGLVLAHLASKQGAESGVLTAGRVTAIIGIVLHVLIYAFFLFTIFAAIFASTY